MKSTAVASLLGAASLALASPATVEKRATVPHVTVSGNAFFADGKRFFVRGIDYQPGGSSANKDPLADPAICRRDLEKFKALGINSVRVYSTDNSLDHKECMDAYAAAGIYLMFDVNNPKYSINRENWAPSYNEVYLQSVFATIDEFARFDNTMAFFSGNEVLHDNVTLTPGARFVKAVTRDMRGYLTRRGYRQIPVGYSAADVSENRMQLAQYFNCGTDDERSDFFAFNDYSWCSSDFKTAAWDVKVRNFTNYGLPIFLSEYGCNKNVRNFGEIQALMSADMTSVYSGGLMYEYTVEAAGYGIVKVNPDGSLQEMQPEFNNFKKALADNPAPTAAALGSTTTHSVACPSPDAHWLVSNTLLPALPTAALKYFTDGAGKGPGLNGPGSQNSGPPESQQPDAKAGSGFAVAGNNNGTNGNSGSAGSSVQFSLVATSAVALFAVVGTLLM